MSSESERLRAALSECGLFQAAEDRSLTNDSIGETVPVENANIQELIPDPPAATPTPAAEYEYTDRPAHGGDGSILDALDRVFSHEGARAKPANVTHFQRAEPAEPAPAPAKPTNQNINIHNGNFDRILQIQSEAQAAGARKVYFEECAEGFRAYSYNNGNLIEFGVLPSAIEAALRNSSISGAGSRVSIEAVPQRYHSIFVMTWPRPKNWTAPELEMDAETAEIIQKAVRSEGGAFICIVSPRGRGADEALEALAARFQAANKRIVSRGGLSNFSNIHNLVDLPDDVSDAAAIARDGEAYFFPMITNRESAARAMAFAFGGWKSVAVLPAEDAAAAPSILQFHGCGEGHLAGANAIFLQIASMRKLCVLCKKSDGRAARAAEELQESAAGRPAGEYYEAGECAKCKNGYSGSLVIARSAGPASTRDEFLTFALSVAARGRTSLDEIHRVLSVDIH